ncbi:hypothetical protein [Methylotetracoccus oryzae]|uniref:hypothetical protein n=1 Tax=Methylotetracoccus oryzae TaxID=1919059 RepID=UPI0019145435|nr:hypothetical protein [Methylotetracoccus oryzae]
MAAHPKRMLRKAPHMRFYRGFDLSAIARSLRQTQARFNEINRRLCVPRDDLDSEVVDNLLEAYAYVDGLIQRGVDLFAPGRSNCLLEINRLVLVGSSSVRRQRYASHLDATERRFYEEREGGIRDLVEWVQDHSRDEVWARAAGVYIRILSKPQLFLEGNHRSGALVMSYVLGREDLPPFVLTPDNAPTYFDPSSLITNTSKTSLAMLFRMPSVRRRFAGFLEAQSRPDFLLPPAATQGDEPFRQGPGPKA